jgi:hypothetical protein
MCEPNEKDVQIGVGSVGKSASVSPTFRRDSEEAMRLDIEYYEVESARLRNQRESHLIEVRSLDTQIEQNRKYIERQRQLLRDFK